MNRWQRQVRDFHEKFGVPVGDSLNLDERELRAKLILEEAVETVAAMGFEVDCELYGPDSAPHVAGPRIATFEGIPPSSVGDIVEVADGIADLIYVALGAAIAFGIDIDPIFEEVHRTNMEKVGGRTRDDGKILKPEGWEPPRILPILLDQDMAHLRRGAA